MLSAKLTLVKHNVVSTTTPCRSGDKCENEGRGIPEANSINIIQSDTPSTTKQQKVRVKSQQNITESYGKIMNQAGAATNLMPREFENNVTIQSKITISNSECKDTVTIGVRIGKMDDGELTEEGIQIIADIRNDETLITVIVSPLQYMQEIEKNQEDMNAMLPNILLEPTKLDLHLNGVVLMNLQDNKEFVYLLVGITHNIRYLMRNIRAADSKARIVVLMFHKTQPEAFYDNHKVYDMYLLTPIDNNCGPGCTLGYGFI